MTNTCICRACHYGHYDECEAPCGGGPRAVEEDQ